MRRPALTLVLMTLTAVLWLACGPTAQPAPDFRLATLDGEWLGPADFPGEVVIVDFWATWCQPCRLQADVIKRVRASIGEDNVRFLAVNVGEDEELVRRHLAADPPPYPVLLDPANTLMSELGIAGLPTLMVVDTRGQMRYLEAGVIGESELRDLIRRAGA